MAERPSSQQNQRVAPAAAGLTLRAVWLSDVGRARDHQEDSGGARACHGRAAASGSGRRSTVAQASAVAGKVLVMFSREQLSREPEIAKVNETNCAACFACVRTCPTNARHFGDLGDPNSAVSRMVVERGGIDLMPEQETPS